MRAVGTTPSTSSGLAPVETFSVKDATVIEDNNSQTSRVISPTPSEQSGIVRLGKTQKRFNQQEKLVKVLLVTILAFKVCWFPFAVYSILETLDLHASDSSSFPLVAAWLAFSNTICNPIIYAFLNKQFKMAFKDVIRVLCRGKQIIHPGQIEIVNKAFSPSEEKVKWARDLVNAFEEQERVGKGAINFHGNMIDMPTVQQARNVLRLAEATQKK
ncbi:hypothetical protein pdam_00013926 [Pocillopora damicornis]|uniref:G-protein coupled receptors family 1 profile domain-containing protein n=1 Tax=Pocillopora damicornis TaxID=46731 RepID=A0A3M6UBT6_POCDA|nr:hypothetical protein pdam_00013926 [Pocillopora damicornis]